MAADGQIRQTRQLFDVGSQLRSTQRAVEPDGEEIRVTDGVPERLDRLSRQRPSARVRDRPRHHQWDIEPALIQQAPHREERSLAVERIEDRLDHEQVDPALEERVGLSAIGGGELRERDVPETRIVDVGRKRRSAVRRPEDADHEAWPLGRAHCHRVGFAARELRRGHVELVHRVFCPIVALRDHLGVERIGLEQVGTGLEVAAVDLGDDVGPRDGQEIIVATQILGMRAEPLPAEILLLQRVRLDHRAHGAVEDEDALRERVAKLGKAFPTIGHSEKKDPRRQCGRGSAPAF